MIKYQNELTLGSDYDNKIELTIRLKKTPSKEAYADIMTVMETLKDIAAVYVIEPDKSNE